MIEPVEYVHLPPQSPLPARVIARPFRAVLILEGEVEAIWQRQVSRWLVQSGCLYALSVGAGCGAWETAIDEAHLEQFDFDDITPDPFVITTSHPYESLSEVFGFAKHVAFHPAAPLSTTVLLHVGAVPNEMVWLEAYAAA